MKLLVELAFLGDTFVLMDPLNPALHPNKTWTDMLEWEVDNFDIAADYWARSTDCMSRGISFPQGWYDGSVILVDFREFRWGQVQLMELPPAF
jgi:hypothetical protein